MRRGVFLVLTGLAACLPPEDDDVGPIVLPGDDTDVVVDTVVDDSDVGDTDTDVVDTDTDVGDTDTDVGDTETIDTFDTVVADTWDTTILAR